MERILNEDGKDLNLIKFKLIKGEIPEDIVPIIISKYPTNIQELLMDKSLDIKTFTEKLKFHKKYCLTEEEVQKLSAKGLASTYEYEIAKTHDKFTVKIVGNTLKVGKFFRISQQYYRNFVGIDLPHLANEAKASKKRSSYGYGSWSKNSDDRTYEQKKYDAEKEIFDKFTANRFKVVLNSLNDEIFDKKIIPMYKTIKDVNRRPMRLANKIEENVATIGLCIDLDTKDELDKNIKVINKFLTLVNEEIEKHMNYSLYK